MFPIPWKMYSELEILEVLTEVFRAKGYEVYNIHKTDRRGELGVDLECTKLAENQKITLAVKKHPEKSDVAQLEEFAKRSSNSRIYVFIEEPSSAFKNAMEGFKSQVSFWNAETLTYELFCTDLRFYLFMVLENSFEKHIFEIIRSFFKVLFAVEKKKVEPPLKATSEMLNLLWVAKDRSSSLHKSLRTLQLFFERMSLPDVAEEARRAMTFAFLESIENLKYENLDQLQSHFSEFMDKYPANFEQYCKQTKGRSDWTYFAATQPILSPNYIIKSLENGRETTRTMKELFEKRFTPKLKPPSLSETLGDVARILANEVYMFEDTVDDLFSIGLFGEWDDMREELSRTSKERSDELRNAIRKELSVIKKEIDKNLKNERFQTSIFSREAFANYEGELRQYLRPSIFLSLQQTYSKIIALESPSNLLDVNKRRHKEARNLVDEAIKMLDKKDIFDGFEAARSLRMRRAISKTMA